MTQFTTELVDFLAQNNNLDEFFRNLLEQAMNDLLQSELTAMLGYEKHSTDGYNTGNSRNGSYTRSLDTKYGKVNLTIPRDRNGEFSTGLFDSHQRRDDYLEEMVIRLYQKGSSTRDIADIIEKLYGHHYSPATVSNITQLTQENVEAFHQRSLKDMYSVLFLDGTYLPLRRKTVSKECIHLAIGITHDGHKEILGYEIAPNENNESWKDLLDRLKSQGVQQVSLIVTDGLVGLDQVLHQAFPLAKQQRCLVHVGRNIFSNVKKKDQPEIAKQFKEIYKSPTAEEAMKRLAAFTNEWEDAYPKRMKKLAETANLFTFYQFPEEIRQSIYSTNLIENVNKEIKRRVKKHILFPDESALERFLVGLFEEYNAINLSRTHRGFKTCQDTLESFFE